MDEMAFSQTSSMHSSANHSTRSFNRQTIQDDSSLLFGSSVQAGADAEHFALIGFEDFEAHTVGVENFAGARNVAGDAVEQTCNRAGAGMLHSGVELDTEEFANLIHGNASANN